MTTPVSPAPATPVRSLQTFFRDAVERALSVFVWTFAGIMVGAEVTDMVDPSFWQGALSASVAAGLDAIKSFIFRVFGVRNSASADPQV